MFYFFYEIIFFRHIKERIETIYKARMYTLFLYFMKLKVITPHIAHVIFMLHSTMKTLLLTNENARIIYPNYFIIKFQICELLLRTV